MSHRCGLGAWGIALLSAVATTGCITGEVAPKSTETGGHGGATTATSGAGRGGTNGGATNTGARNGGAAGTGAGATTAGTSPLSNAGGLSSTITAGTGGVGSVTAGATNASSNGGVAGTAIAVGNGGSTASGGAVGTSGSNATGGTSSIGVSGATTSGGKAATGGVSAVGGVGTGGATTTGGNPSAGGIAATGGVGTAGVAGTNGGPTCSDNVQNGDETAVDCGGACGSTCKPGQACTAPKDCASFVCTNNVCGTYANGCLQLKQRGAPPGKYVLDTDGDDYKEPFLAYCPTVGTNLAPVGICQAESGAPPACRSFVGAVGFDFKGVDFGGAMKDAGVLDLASQPISADRELIELGDGSLLTTIVTQGSANHYFSDGTSTAFGSGFVGPHGVLETFDKQILVCGGPEHKVSIFTMAGALAMALPTTSSVSATQLISGEIWATSVSVFKVFRFGADATALGSFENPALTTAQVGYGPHGIVQLADGTIIVSNSGDIPVGGSVVGRMLVVEADLTPRVFAQIPKGMTQNTDGSFTPPAMSFLGNLLQLPNGQVLVSSSVDSRIVRLTSSGAYVDTFLTSSGLQPYGMTMDHRGRLLVASTSDRRAHVITFPGCSSGTQDTTETDIDCGGPCTKKCGSSRKCLQNTDCNSGVCTFNYCDGG